MISPQQATRVHSPRKMLHLVTMHMGLAAHQGVRCKWCLDGLVRRFDTDQLVTCEHCHGFGKVEQ